MKKCILIPALLGLGAVMATGLANDCEKKSSAAWAKIDSEFLNPPNQYRVVQYSGHEGAIIAGSGN